MLTSLKWISVSTGEFHSALPPPKNVTKLSRLNLIEGFVRHVTPESVFERPLTVSVTVPSALPGELSTTEKLKSFHCPATAYKSSAVFECHKSMPAPLLGLPTVLI